MTEIFRNREIEVDPEDIEGHDYRVPLIDWRGYGYGLYGLYLPYDWQDEISRLKELDENYLSTATSIKFDESNIFDYRLKVDDSLGLITELQVLRAGEGQSAVRLDTSFARSGMYIGEDIRNLDTAIKYLEIMSKYLGIVSEDKLTYPYIVSGGHDNCYSENLVVPEKLRNVKNQVPSDFVLKAHRITGQFGTNLRHVSFNEEGLISEVSIDSNECKYILESKAYSYYSHNVDNSFQAATLHSIVGTSINELLKKDSLESWR